MLFKSKLRKIIKNEKQGLIAFLIILILGLMLICVYIIDSTLYHYNPSLVWNLLGILLVYCLFGIIAFKKTKTIKELRWSIENYEEYPQVVKNILKKRKSTLMSSHGQIGLYTHYDEALQLFYNLDLKKCG